MARDNRPMRRGLPRLGSCRGGDFSAWLLVLLATAVLFFVSEVPGRRRSGRRNALHWLAGCVSPTRDAVNDPLPGGGAALGTLGPLSPLILDSTTASDANWEAGQLPLAVEDAVNPWSFGGGEIKRLAVAADAAFALLMLFLVGQLRQAWRNRHPPARRGRFFQYRLRTLLIAVPLVAFVSAKLAAWHNEYVAEQELLPAITPAALAGRRFDGDALAAAGMDAGKPAQALPDELVRPRRSPRDPQPERSRRRSM